MPHRGYLIGAFALLVAIFPSCGWGQHITVDGSLSPAQTLVGPNYMIGAGLGRQTGGNLFQSFGLFSLSTGESANFTGPAGVSNIIARVTGGVSSSIDGTIGSSIAGANLFLINPAGIMFGANAQVNVTGAFHATTADYLRFTDNAVFSASTPSGSTFTSAAPQAFGFLSDNPGAALSVNGSTLAVATGQQLSLVGSSGGVSLSSAAISAPSGVVHIASIAGAGEIGVNPADLASLTAASFGPVSITAGTSIAADGAPAGAVYVRGGVLSIDASTITSNHDGAGTGGGISLVGTTSIALTSGSVVDIDNNGSGAPGTLSLQGGSIDIDGFSTVLSQTFGAGPGAPITISGTDVTMTNGAQVVSSTFSTTGGNGGDITVSASGSLMIDGTGAADFGVNTGIGTMVQPGASGNAGNVTVSVGGTLTINEGGAISSETGESGNTGSITVTAGTITTDDSEAPIVGGIISAVDSPSFFIFLSGADTASGNGGEVDVTAGQITVTGSSQIGSVNFGTGTTGNVFVNRDLPSGNITLDGSAFLGGLTGIFSFSANGSDAGSVTIQGNQIMLVANGQIFSTSFAGGNPGNVSVTGGTIVIDGTAAEGTSTSISTSTSGVGPGGGAITVQATQLTLTGQGAAISSSTLSDGAAGSVTVRATSLTINNGGAVSSSTGGGAGDAGAVSVTGGSITIASAGVISSDTLGVGNAGAVTVSAGSLAIAGDGDSGRTGIGSDAEPGSTGNAGTVAVTASSISLASNGAITSTTFSSGAGGQVTVTAGTISADGSGAAAGLATGIASDSDVGASGDAGSVTVNPGSLMLENGATIASASKGSGNGGNVTVTGGDIGIEGSNPSGAAAITAAAVGTGAAGTITINATSLTLQNGGLISTRSVAGGGGDLVIHATKLVDLDHSAITTSVSGGLGNGGNITIDPPFVILSDSEIIAEAFGGNGGSISITAAELITDPSSLISASSALGISGTILIQSPGTDVTASIAELSGKIAPPPNLTGASCGAAVAARSSILTSAGTGGLPQSGQGPLTASYFVDHPVNEAATGDGRIELASGQETAQCR